MSLAWLKFMIGTNFFQTLAPFFVLGIAFSANMDLMLSEKNPAFIKAMTRSERFHATGATLCVISFFFLLGLTILGAGLDHVPMSAELKDAFANNRLNPETLFLPQAILAALVLGLFIKTPVTHFRYQAVQRITTEGYSGITSIQPFMIMGLEGLLYLFGAGHMRHIDWEMLIAAVICTIGHFIIFWGRHKTR